MHGYNGGGGRKKSEVKRNLWFIDDYRQREIKYMVVNYCYT